MKVSDLLNVEITDLALGGKALARHEGRVVFVDRGVPGDRARVRLTRIKPSYAESRLEAVETPSALRVEAPCPHVPRCGGCRFQDLAYDAQLAAKELQVRDALARIGGLPEAMVRPIVPAPERFRYRNKMEFAFHPDPEGRAILGLH